MIHVYRDYQQFTRPATEYNLLEKAIIAHGALPEPAVGKHTGTNTFLLRRICDAHNICFEEKAPS
jgi:hypothetical protein